MLWDSVDVRVVTERVSDLPSRIETYLARKGLSATRQEKQASETHIVAETPQRAFWSLCMNNLPQLIDWHLKAVPKGTEVRVEFGWRPDYTRKYFLLVSALFLISGYLSGAARSKDAILPFLSTAVLLATAGIGIVTRLTESTAYDALIDGFYSELRGQRGPEVVINKFLGPPYSLEILISIVAAAAMGILRHAMTPLGVLLFVAVAIFLIAPALALLFCACRSRSLSRRSVFVAFGLMAQGRMFLYAGVGAALVATWRLAELGGQSGASAAVALGSGGILLCPTIAFLLFYVAGAGEAINELRTTGDAFRQEIAVALPQPLTQRERFLERIFPVSVLFIWGGLTLINLCALGLFLLIGRFALTGLYGIPRSAYLPDSALGFYKLILAESRFDGLAIARLSAWIYLIPLLFLLLEIGRRKIRKMRQPSRSAAGILPAERDVSRALDAICKYAGVPRPYLVVVDSAFIQASTGHRTLLDSRPCLQLTSGAAQLLSSEEMQALLAHEVGHLKNDVLRFRLLNALSNLTVWGNGFLAVLFDSFKVEFLADEFAVGYLRELGMSPVVLQRLLIKMEANNSLQPSHGGTGAGSPLCIVDDFGREMPSLSLSDQRGPVAKTRKLLDIFVELYFGDRVLSYFHPSLRDRLDRIASITSTNAAAA